MGASTARGTVAEMGVVGVERGLGIGVSGMGRSWTKGLGVAEETYLTALDFRGSGLESGTGLDRDIGTFFEIFSMLVFATASTGLALDFWAFFFLISAVGLGAASSSLETALLFWALGSTSIATSGFGFGFALAGEVGGVDFRGLF